MRYKNGLRVFARARRALRIPNIWLFLGRKGKDSLIFRPSTQPYVKVYYSSGVHPRARRPHSQGIIDFFFSFILFAFLLLFGSESRDGSGILNRSSKDLTGALHMCTQQDKQKQEIGQRK